MMHRGWNARSCSFTDWPTTTWWWRTRCGYRRRSWPPDSGSTVCGVTHMARQEEVAENLMLLQVEFLKRTLGMSPG